MSRRSTSPGNDPRSHRVDPYDRYERDEVRARDRREAPYPSDRSQYSASAMASGSSSAHLAARGYDEERERYRRRRSRSRGEDEREREHYARLEYEREERRRLADLRREVQTDRIQDDRERERRGSRDYAHHAMATGPGAGRSAQAYGMDTSPPFSRSAHRPASSRMSPAASHRMPSPSQASVASAALGGMGSPPGQSGTSGSPGPSYGERPQSREDALRRRSVAGYEDPPTAGPSSRAGAEWTTFTPDLSRGSGNKSGVKRDQPTAHIMKKEDGDMCSREDIQHDLLEHIFADRTCCFTVPPVASAPRPIEPSSDPSAPPTRLCFADLYAYALAASPKITKGLKEALLDLQPGGLPGKTKAGHGKSRRKKQDGDEDELAEADMESYDGLKMGFMKLCLLVNIGRINTTFAFYPEMRTILRAYHSVPSLQKTVATKKSMQDAPRMKNGLKASKLVSEDPQVPTTVQEVEDLLAQGKVPPTTPANMLFIMANQPDVINERHFKPYKGIVDCLGLFCPEPIPSAQRAKMFLWLMFHYLEPRARTNPFSEDESGQPPRLEPLSPAQYAELDENVDTQTEVDFGNIMRENRMEFLTSLANGTAVTGKIFASAEPKDHRGDRRQVKEESVADSSKGLGIGKMDGPVPMSVARVKDAQAIVNRKLKRTKDANSPVYEGDNQARRRRRTHSREPDSLPAEYGSPMGLGLHRSPEYASRLAHQHIDTYGLDDQRLHQLRLQAEQDVGPPPPRSPEVRWRDYEPDLKPFTTVLPPDYRARSHLLDLPPPRIPHGEDRAGLRRDASPPLRSSLQVSLHRQQSERSTPAESPKSEDQAAGPSNTATADRGKSIMSLLN